MSNFSRFVTAIALVALGALAASGCRQAAAPAVAGESAALRQAKALIDRNASEFELAVQGAVGIDSNPERAKALGDQLRKGLESRRTEAEALEKKLTEEDKTKLREYGRQRLLPAVQALEKKLASAPAVTGAPGVPGAVEPAPGGARLDAPAAAPAAATAVGG